MHWSERRGCAFLFSSLNPQTNSNEIFLWSLKYNKIMFKISVLASQKNCALLQWPMLFWKLTDIYFQNHIKHIYPIRGQMLSFYMLKNIVPKVTTVQCFNGLKTQRKYAIISMLHCYAWDLGSVPQLQTFGDNYFNAVCEKKQKLWLLEMQFGTEVWSGSKCLWQWFGTVQHLHQRQVHDFDLSVSTAWIKDICDRDLPLSTAWNKDIFVT